MPKKVDANQPEIVEALRRVGATVQSLHMVGQGCPDLLVGYLGRNYLFEVKKPGYYPAHLLTPDEAKWHVFWKGDARIAQSVDDVLRAIGV